MGLKQYGPNMVVSKPGTPGVPPGEFWVMGWASNSGQPNTVATNWIRVAGDPANGGTWRVTSVGGSNDGDISPEWLMGRPGTQYAGYSVDGNFNLIAPGAAVAGAPAAQLVPTSAGTAVVVQPQVLANGLMRFRWADFVAIAADFVACFMPTPEAPKLLDDEKKDAENEVIYLTALANFARRDEIIRLGGEALLTFARAQGVTADASGNVTMWPGKFAQLIADGFATLTALPAPPKTFHESANTNRKNRLLYQSTLATAARTDEQTRFFGKAITMIFSGAPN